MNVSGQDMALLGLELSELKIQVNSLPYSNIIIELFDLLINWEILWEAVMLTNHSIHSIFHVNRDVCHITILQPHWNGTVRDPSHESRKCSKISLWPGSIEGWTMIQCSLWTYVCVFHPCPCLIIWRLCPFRAWGGRSTHFLHLKC